MIKAGTRDLAIQQAGIGKSRFKETEIREFQRLKYAKIIKLSL